MAAQSLPVIADKVAKEAYPAKVVELSQKVFDVLDKQAQEFEPMPKREKQPVCRESAREYTMEHFHPESTNWKPLYEAVLVEADPSKLPGRITAARSAILDRIEESLTSSLPGEHRAMDDVLRNLRRLAERPCEQPA